MKKNKYWLRKEGEVERDERGLPKRTGCKDPDQEKGWCFVKSASK